MGEETNILNNQETKKGFTLIELLVVVAIISLLSSIVYASLNSARMKARNAARVSAVEQLRNAFNLALSDGPIPDVAYSFPCLSTTCVWNGSTYVGDATIDAYIAPYIKKSADPSGGALGYVGFLLTTPTNWASGSPPTFPAGYFYVHYILEPPADCGPGKYLTPVAGGGIQCALQL